MTQEMPNQMEERGEPAGMKEGAENPLKEIVLQTDQALGRIAEVLGQSSPEAAQALMQLKDGFRQVIQQAMSGGQGGGAKRAPEMAPPETGGRPAQPAL